MSGKKYDPPNVPTNGDCIPIGLIGPSSRNQYKPPPEGKSKVLEQLHR